MASHDKDGTEVLNQQPPPPMAVVASFSKITEYGAIGAMLILTAMGLAYVWDKYHEESVDVRKDMTVSIVEDRKTMLRDRALLLDKFILLSGERVKEHREDVGHMFDLVVKQCESHISSLKESLDKQHELIIKFQESSRK